MNIYIGNLSLETTVEELRNEFMKFGEVVAVTIMNDKYIGSGQLRGYGYIQMASKEEGANAIASIEGKMINNRAITAVQALPLTRTEIKILDKNSKKRSNNRRLRNSLPDSSLPAH